MCVAAWQPAQRRRCEDASFNALFAAFFFKRNIALFSKDINRCWLVPTSQLRIGFKTQKYTHSSKNFKKEKKA